MKPELLAPAGDLEKVKVALLYGADAVYIGGQQFSLRARASKFDLKEIQKAVDFAHNMKRKIYVTTNIIPHDEDLPELDRYLWQLDEMGVDAIIASNPYVIERAQQLTGLSVHLSTQFSASNSALCNFWQTRGVKRIVLARELSLEEIAQVRSNTTAQLEVFIHGGMCVSYSGRCTLSNVMSNRDANRGGCAHSCRWNYRLYREQKLIAPNFQMASKDLETLRFIPELIAIGVDSFKIEGRMKSIHYIATIVHTYRKLIDDYISGQMEPIEMYENEIRKAENRLTGSGFMQGITTKNEQLYDQDSLPPTKDFVGVVVHYDEKKQLAMVEQRNYFAPGDKLEVFSPNRQREYLILQDLFNDNQEALDAARHPMQKVFFHSPIMLRPYDLLRKVETK